MNCAYHSHNIAVGQCNGCGKPLCPGCDHRIKGFPHCQDCIVSGIELLRHQRSQPSLAPIVKKQSSPLIATLLSLICPGLGGAYNGQTSKAFVHFGIFVGLFQMAVLTRATAMFVFGFVAMWLYAAVDSWRTAQLIRTGITPEAAEDLIYKRLSSNPKVWGIALMALGTIFVINMVSGFRLNLVWLLPMLLIGSGVYFLREYLKKNSINQPETKDFYFEANPRSVVTGTFSGNSEQTNFRNGDYQTEKFSDRRETTRFEKSS